MHCLIHPVKYLLYLLLLIAIIAILQTKREAIYIDSSSGLIQYRCSIIGYTYHIITYETVLSKLIKDEGIQFDDPHWIVCSARECNYYPFYKGNRCRYYTIAILHEIESFELILTYDIDLNHKERRELANALVEWINNGDYKNSPSELFIEICLRNNAGLAKDNDSIHNENSKLTLDKEAFKSFLTIIRGVDE